MVDMVIFSQFNFQIFFSSHKKTENQGILRCFSKYGVNRRFKLYLRFKNTNFSNNINLLFKISIFRFTNI